MLCITLSLANVPVTEQEVKALLGTENVTIEFTEDGIDELAR